MMSALPAVAIRPLQVDRKKPRFTPGPYHVSGSGPKMRSIKSAEGRTIAYVLFSQRRESECESTARLMAAAPDLLLELRSGRSSLSRLDSQFALPDLRPQTFGSGAFGPSSFWTEMFGSGNRAAV